MPRVRLPTNVLELNGTIAHDRKKYAARELEPKPTEPLGDPPAHLTKAVRDCWVEIAGAVHPGTSSAADRLAMEHGAQLLYRLRKAKWDLPAPILAQFMNFLARFGMTPADRSRIQVQKPAKPTVDPLDEFAPPKTG